MELSTKIRFTAESEELDYEGNIVKTTRTGSYPMETITADKLIESDLAGGDFSKFPGVPVDNSNKFLMLGTMFKVDNKASFYSGLWFNNVKNVYSELVAGRFRYVVLENGKLSKRWEDVMNKATEKPKTKKKKTKKNKDKKKYEIHDYSV